MARVERIRQPVAGELPPEDVQRFRAQGWRLVALEWERDLAPEETPGPAREEIPFGLQAPGGLAGLEENPHEVNTMTTMLELLVEEGPYWRVAEELNRRGYRTREGTKWTPVSVFEMLPRLVEVAPRIFSSEAWQRRRQPHLPAL